MGKLCILRLRPLSITDIRFARMIKPFEDYGLVEDIWQDPVLTLGIIHEAITQNQLAQFTEGRIKMAPSGIVSAILNKEATISLLVSAIKNMDGKYSDFRYIASHQQLQGIIAGAKDRGDLPEDVKIPSIKPGRQSYEWD